MRAHLAFAFVRRRVATQLGAKNSIAHARKSTLAMVVSSTWNVSVSFVPFVDQGTSLFKNVVAAFGPNSSTNERPLQSLVLVRRNIALNFCPSCKLTRDCNRVLADIGHHKSTSFCGHRLCDGWIGKAHQGLASVGGDPHHSLS